MLRVAALLAVTTACGRIAFEPRSDSGVGATDATATDVLLACPPGYTFDTGSCYRTSTVVADWLTAEAACEADGRGAHLAVIDSPAEAMVVDRYRPTPTDFAWIGATDVNTEGQYQSVTNRPHGYLLFGAGEPAGAAEDCIRLKDNLELGDGTCTTVDDYICEYDGIAAASPAWGVCPAGYTFLAPGGCYRTVLSGPGSTWLASELACEADGPGSHLVVLDSVPEAMAIDGFAPGTIVDHWVGASDRVNEAAFPSVTNGPFGFTGFASGEPDGGTAENCLLFDDAVELSTTDCDTDDDYVCEYDGILAVPAAYGQ